MSASGHNNLLDYAEGIVDAARDNRLIRPDCVECIPTANYIKTTVAASMKQGPKGREAATGKGIEGYLNEIASCTGQVCLGKQLAQDTQQP